MKRIVFISLFLSINSYYAQSTILHNLNHDRLMSNALNKIGNIELNDNDFVGSPFLEKDFLPSIIKGEKGVHLLRYNIFNDEIILKRDSEYFKIPKTDLDYFKINDKYIVRLVNDTYYIQVSEKEVNNYVILRKDKIKFTQGKISDTGYGQNTPSKFTNLKADYFLYNLENKKLVPFKKEDLQKAYQMKENEIFQFFKTNKLKKDEDYNEFLKIISN